MTPIQFTGDITTLQRAGYHPHRDCFGVYLLTIPGHLYLSVGDYVVAHRTKGVQRMSAEKYEQVRREVAETLWNRSEEMAA